MNKKEIMDTFLKSFGMIDPTISESEIIKRTFSNKSLYDKFEKLSELFIIMGELEFAKGEKAGMLKTQEIAKEIGIKL